MTMIHPSREQLFGLERLGIEKRPAMSPELQLEAQIMNGLYDLVAAAGQEAVVRTEPMFDIGDEKTYEQCLAVNHLQGTAPWLSYVEYMVVGSEEPTARQVRYHGDASHQQQITLHMSEDHLPPVISRSYYKHGAYHTVAIDEDRSDEREAYLELVRDEIEAAVSAYDRLDHARGQALAQRVLRHAA